MAKLYNITTLRKIHAEKRASNGVIYQSEDKRVDGGIRYFLGDGDGRLEEVTDITLIDEHNEVTNVIEADLTAIEARVTTLEQTKADKCFAMVMSIVL